MSKWQRGSFRTTVSVSRVQNTPDNLRWLPQTEWALQTSIYAYFREYTTDRLCSLPHKVKSRKTWQRAERENIHEKVKDYWNTAGQTTHPCDKKQLILLLENYQRLDWMSLCSFYIVLYSHECIRLLLGCTVSLRFSACTGFEKREMDELDMEESLPLNATIIMIRPNFYQSTVLKNAV